MIWGQCMSVLKGAIQSREKFEEKDTEKDPIWLLRQLREELTGVDQTAACKHATLIKAQKNFLNMRQQPNDTFKTIIFK